MESSSFIDKVKSDIDAVKAKIKSITGDRSKDAQERAKSVLEQRALLEILEHDMQAEEVEAHKNRLIAEAQKTRDTAKKELDIVMASAKTIAKLDAKKNKHIQELVEVFEEEQELQGNFSEATENDIIRAWKYFAKSQKVRNLLTLPPQHYTAELQKPIETPVNHTVAIAKKKLEQTDTELERIKANADQLVADMLKPQKIAGTPKAKPVDDEFRVSPLSQSVNLRDGTAIDDIESDLSHSH